MAKRKGPENVLDVWIDAEEGGPIQYGSWETYERKNHTLMRLIQYATGSDYYGSLVERSNYLALLEDFGDELMEVYGGHGTYGLLYDPSTASEELIEAIEKLDDYPLYNEDHHSNLEMETAHEQWENWGRQDLRRELADHASEDMQDEGFSDFISDDLSDAALDEIFWNNEYKLPHYESEGMGYENIIFPIGDVVKSKKVWVALEGAYDDYQTEGLKKNPSKASHTYKVGDKATRISKKLTPDQAQLIITEVGINGRDTNGRSKPAVRAIQPSFTTPGHRGYIYLLEEIRPGW